MILELLLNILVTLGGFVFGFIDVDLVMLETISETVFDVLGGIMYFLPAQTVFMIFTMFCSLMVFRIIVAFFRSLWGVIPIL